MGADRGLARAIRSLHRATAARCRGATLAITRGDGGLGEALRARGIEATELDARTARATIASLAIGAFGTVVLLDVLDLVLEGGDSEFGALERLLRPGGRMIVTVPNEEAEEGLPAARAPGRRALRRILRRIGKPRLAADQPYRWLTMTADRPRAGEKPNRPRRDRYRVTARLARGRNAVELGCGEGMLSRMISDRGIEAVGVDISAEKIRIARERHPGISFIESDIRTAPLPDESFDTAIIAEVLEHVDDAAGGEILEKAWRLLRPGGRLIVSVPNEDCIPHPNHVREFDRRALARMLRPLGKPRPVVDQPYKWLLMYVRKRP